MFCYDPQYAEMQKITAEAVKLTGSPITAVQAVILATEEICGEKGKGMMYRSKRKMLEAWVRRDLKVAKMGKTQ